MTSLNRQLLALVAGLLVALGSAACSPDTAGPTQVTAAESARFIETDNWWSMDIPRTWQAVRIELDGARTQLRDWHESPEPTQSPMWDLNSTGVIYQFHEGPPCDDCAVTDRARIAVAALPTADANRASRDAADSLKDTRDIRDLSAGTFPCGNLQCAYVSYLVRDEQVRVDYYPAPHQERTYEIRTTAPLREYSTLRPTFERSVASFRAGERS